jgi:hypothetical protein
MALFSRCRFDLPLAPLRFDSAIFLQSIRSDLSSAQMSFSRSLRFDLSLAVDSICPLLYFDSRLDSICLSLSIRFAPRSTSIRFGSLLAVDSLRVVARSNVLFSVASIRSASRCRIDLPLALLSRSPRFYFDSIRLSSRSRFALSARSNVLFSVLFSVSLIRSASRCRFDFPLALLRFDSALFSQSIRSESSLAQMSFSRSRRFYLPLVVESTCPSLYFDSIRLSSRSRFSPIRFGSLLPVASLQVVAGSNVPFSVASIRSASCRRFDLPLALTRFNFALFSQSIRFAFPSTSMIASIRSASCRRFDLPLALFRF